VLITRETDNIITLGVKLDSSITGTHMVQATRDTGRRRESKYLLSLFLYLVLMYVKMS
jgi:hypothetical protein